MLLGRGRRGRVYWAVWQLRQVLTCWSLDGSVRPQQLGGSKGQRARYAGGIWGVLRAKSHRTLEIPKELLRMG